MSKMQKDLEQVSLPLIGLHELHEFLGQHHKEATARITRKEGFPEPVARLACGKVWSKPEIENYMDAMSR